jgi:hypothetical protein
MKRLGIRCLFLIGEVIKQARKAKNLTQEQLGELMGVKRAQIPKIESGKSATFSTILSLLNRIDEEEIFNVIKRDLDPLLNTIRQMKTDLSV